MAELLSGTNGEESPGARADIALGLGPLDLSRQTRNLLLARPLHELAVKVRRADFGNGEFQDIDTHYLALAMFDFIMEGSTFGLGRLREDVVSYLADLVRRMKPGLGNDLCNLLALEVLDSVHNKENRNEQFDFPYYDVGSNSTRSFRFNLLTFERQDDNQYQYRLTESAILLYIGQLDIGPSRCKRFWTG